MINNLLRMNLTTTSKRAIQKTTERAGDLIGNKIADKITIVSNFPPQNNSGTNEEENRREIFIPPKLRNKITDDLRLI